MPTDKNEGARWPAEVPGHCHPKIRDFVDYWLSIHPPARLPGRQHFDPAAVPQLLANIRLLDVVGMPPRFFTRVMGTRLREFYGNEHTGRWYDELFPHFAQSRTYANLMSTVETRRPSWRRGKPHLDFEREFVALERILLPLARDGENVDMIVTLVLFGNDSGQFS